MGTDSLYNSGLESACTNLLTRAMQIYQSTFGLIPPIFVDIKFDKDRAIQLKYISPNKNALLCLWHACVLLLAISVSGIIFLVLLLRLLSQNYIKLSILETFILLLSLGYAILFFLCLIGFSRHRDLLPQINSFIKGGLKLGTNNNIFDFNVKIHRL